MRLAVYEIYFDNDDDPGDGLLDSGYVYLKYNHLRQEVVGDF